MTYFLIYDFARPVVKKSAAEELYRCRFDYLRFVNLQSGAC